MTRTISTGTHRIGNVRVEWNNGSVTIDRDGVPLRLFIHDCRHGGDGYSPVDVSTLQYPNLYRKIRIANSDNPHYILREAV